MKEIEEKKGRKRSVKEQVLRGLKRIPLAVRIFIIAAAFAGIVFFITGLFRQPKTGINSGTGAFDVSGSRASGTESVEPGIGESGKSEGQKTESSGTSGGQTAESSGTAEGQKTDSSDEERTESSGKPEETADSKKSGEEEIRKLVALTYDDGPSNSTPFILDTLEQYGAKATFFVVGRDQVEYHQDALIRAYNDGMEIGSHTYDHRILSKSTQEEIWETMGKNDELLQNVIGFKPTIMRPTGGGINDTVRASIDRPMILWNIDSLDWKYEDKDTVVNTVKAEVHPGAIILMHDLIETTGDSTWQATAEIVPWLLEQGYELVTVSEMAAAYGFTLEPGSIYYSFNPLWSPNETIAARYQEAFGQKTN